MTFLAVRCGQISIQHWLISWYTRILNRKFYSNGYARKRSASARDGIGCVFVFKLAIRTIKYMVNKNPCASHYYFNDFQVLFWIVRIDSKKKIPTVPESPANSLLSTHACWQLWQVSIHSLSLSLPLHFSSCSSHGNSDFILGNMFCLSFRAKTEKNKANTALKTKTKRSTT